MPIRFVAHADPRRLIGWLRADLDQRRERDPFAPVCVLAPNRRLARFLRRCLVEGGRSLLGVRVLDLWALVSELRSAAPSPSPSSRPAPDFVLRRRVQESLRRRGGRLAQADSGRGGVSRTLLATFGDLREAGVTKEQARLLLERAGADLQQADSPAVEALAVYGLYLESLEDLERHGWVDRAGFVRGALPLAGNWAERQGAVYLAGAYELLGVHATLLCEIGARAPTAILLPLGREGAAWTYGLEFARDFLLEPGEEIEFLKDEEGVGAGARAAGRLFEADRPAAPALEGEALELLHAQGVEAELTAVARRILALSSRGVPLDAIGVVGRGLGAYAPHLAPIFDAHGIPFSTSAQQPLSRFPVAVALRALLRTLALDFERDDLLAFLGSPLARCPQGATPRPDLLERWSAEASLRKGLSAWLEDLPLLARETADEGGEAGAPGERGDRQPEPDGGALQDQLRILTALGGEAEAWRGCRGWEEQAGFVRALAERWLNDFEAPAASDAATAAVRDILAEICSAGAIPGGVEGPADPASFLAALEAELAGARLPIREEDRGGVRVLDGMQARGHAFRVLFLIGFNAGSFPLHLPEDPFLPDSWRRRLRSAEGGGRPVPLRRNLAEEHLLLALWVASAAERLVVSYRRADDDGRAEVASFALRELARLRLGKPDPVALLELAERIPVHPAERLLHFRREQGLLAPAEAGLLAALGTGSPAAVRAWLTKRGEMETGLDAALCWMEERRGRWSPAEGRAGPLPPSSLPPAWSPSGLETLGGCPLRYFFARVLGLPPPPEPAEDGIFDPADWGNRAHALLHDVFGTMRAEGRLGPGVSGESGVEQACRERVSAAWETHFGDLGRTVSRRLPILWEQHAGRWRAALLEFVLGEARRFREQNLELLATEERGSAVLAGGGAEERILVTGRIDRLARTRAGTLLVTDYKSGRSVREHAEGRRALRGTHLQAPLYAWMAAARSGGSATAPVEVEFAGVGPHHVEAPEEALARVGAGDLQKLNPGVEETVRTLVRMAAAGIFPYHHDDEGRCGRCEFESACHHRDRQAREALEGHAEHADYFDTHRKTLRSPTLASVRAARDEENP